MTSSRRVRSVIAGTAAMLTPIASGAVAARPVGHAVEAPVSQAGVRTPVDMLVGAWARVDGQACWAEQIEINPGLLTFQPPGDGVPLRTARFTQSPVPAQVGQMITLSLDGGGSVQLRLIDAARLTDAHGCQYQRDD